MKTTKTGLKDFPKFAWPGGYPLLYVTHDGCVLCADCAKADADAFYADDSFDDGADLEMSVGPNWEDPSLYCDECSERIESAYAEDDAS